MSQSIERKVIVDRKAEASRQSTRSLIFQHIYGACVMLSPLAGIYIVLFCIARVALEILLAYEVFSRHQHYNFLNVLGINTYWPLGISFLIFTIAVMPTSTIGKIQSRL